MSAEGPTPIWTRLLARTSMLTALLRIATLSVGGLMMLALSVYALVLGYWPIALLLLAVTGFALLKILKFVAVFRGSLAGDPTSIIIGND